MTDNYTEQVVIGMLTEDTGRHMLDSGGAHGRHWQTNRKRLGADPDCFDKQPGAWVRFDESGRWEGGISTYRYLVENLVASRAWNDLFAAFNAQEEFADEPWETVMEAFAKAHGMTKSRVGNTYEDDAPLGQHLWWWRVTVDDPVQPECDLIIVRSHNGCDLRGGWSGPRFFDGRHCPAGEMHLAPGIALYCEGDGGHGIAGQLTWLAEDYTRYRHVWVAAPREGKFENVDNSLLSLDNYEFVIEPDDAWVNENGYGGSRVVVKNGVIRCPWCGGVLKPCIEA